MTELANTSDADPTANAMPPLDNPALAPPTPESKALPGPEYKFVLWAHHEDNFEAAAEQVKDCDILALEFVGQTPEHRERLRANFELLLNPDTDNYQRDMVLNVVLKGAHHGGFYTDLISQLPRRGQRVVLIDVPSSPESDDYWRQVQQADRTAKAMTSEMRSVSDQKDAILYYAQILGTLNAYREECMVSQLRDLGEAPDNQGKKIGVLIGAVHSAVYRELAKIHPTERAHIVDASDSMDGTHIRYAHHRQLMRHFALTPERTLPDGLLDRVVLDYHLGRFHEQYIPPVNASVGQQIEFEHKAQDEYVDKLTNDEVAELISEINAIKTNPSLDSDTMGSEIMRILHSRDAVTRERPRRYATPNRHTV